VTYDGDLLYPLTVTNAAGHVLTRTYDGRFGEVLTETDPNNRTTHYRYDALGRPLKTWTVYDSSDFPTQSRSYDSFGIVGAQNVRTDQREGSGATGVLWKKVYFDGLGREIETQTEGPDNKTIAVTTQYNSMGKVSRKSLPYFSGVDTPRWVNFEYDVQGRLIRVTQPDGSESRMSYSQNTTSYLDANHHKKEIVKDAYGRVSRVREFTGTNPYDLYATTHYTYDLLGNLVQVRDRNNNTTTIAYDTMSRKTEMTDPDMGHWTYGYDRNGNLTSQEDARGRIVTFAYDGINRITSKTFPGGKTVTYTYDSGADNAVGRLVTVVDSPTLETTFDYDAIGRVKRVRKRVDGVDYDTRTTYDAMNRPLSLTYPDDTVVNYVYDAGGNLSEVTNYVVFENFDAMGRPGTIRYVGSQVSTSQAFDPDSGRLVSLRTVKPDQTELQDFGYVYDPVGNILSISDGVNGNRSRTFTHDSLDRLATALTDGNPPNGYGSIHYEYTAIGNIDSVTENGQTRVYNYNSTRPHAVDSVGDTTYEYDANGNLVTVRVNGAVAKSLTFDDENRLARITADDNRTLDMTYDYQGNRVKKVLSSPERSTLYIGNHYECTDGSCVKHIFAGGRRVGTKLADGSIIYYHPDHLGGLHVLSRRSDASEQERVSYKPFGEIFADTGAMDYAYKFTGKELDDEAGLYYYGARYYDPFLGRFISPDSIVPSPGDPQSLNRYSYCRNNPLNRIDPTGNFDIGDFFESLFSGFVGGVTFFLSGKNPVLAGMAAGAVKGAFSGDLKNVIVGAGMGGLTAGLGGVAQGALGDVGAYAMLAGSLGYSVHEDGVDGFAYWSAGFIGGAIGYNSAEYVSNNLSIGPASMANGSPSSTDYKTKNAKVPDRMPIPADVRRDLAGYFSDPIPDGGADYNSVTLIKCVPWINRLFGATAYTSGNDIYWDPNSYLYPSKSFTAMVGHELIHVGQYNKYSSFQLRYFCANIADGGYRNNRFEIPAYNVGDKIFYDLSVYGR